ncbi:SF1B family DNA helicase RecD2 [Pueribacillus theae]|uniref:SF1B family DNA helicase RecD2 n=1 Tax=Pueribacillus theae TaxID=2171751 RepID=UPI001F0B8810|nr:ATP-dependent RecD-like DNA helicase [Pueribacillus theae]
MENNRAEPTYIKGSLIHYLFHNEENLYTVARIRVRETTEDLSEKDIVVTGYMPQMYEQETYFFYGHFVQHPKYGKQYQVTMHKRELPETKSGVIQYLSGDLFEGIGKRTAEAIVDALGERAISKILNGRSVLEQVPNLNKEKAQKLYDTLKENEGLERIMIALSDFGFGPQLSMKIYQAYKDETLDIIRENPYQLVYDVEGIGFKRADELGKTFGIKGSHPERIRAGALYMLNELSLQEGHVFLDYETFVQKVKNLLDGDVKIEERAISLEMIHLDEEEKLVLDKERVYLPTLYYAEKGLVTSIKRLMDSRDAISEFAESDFMAALGKQEQKHSIQYADLQCEAIRTALSSPLMILTGGPGTGKTTIIQGIVEVYSELHDLSLRPEDYKKDEPFPFILAAPTGRAAKRMSEATGLPACTIHRLLGWKGETFEHDDENPIQGSLLIIDEVSMVDLWLANQLFKSLPEGIQVVLVGDEDQLPSVQPGQVLKDLLESGLIPTVKLSNIYRQAEGSSIIELAHHIKKGELPENLEKATEDRRFFSCRTDGVGEVVEQICQLSLRKGFSVHDIQVLAPMYKGKAGVDQLNIRLQHLFNPKSKQKRELHYRDTIFRTGDKVLQLVNDSENQVFNGDTGIISAIFFAKENTEKEDQLIVSFDGKEVVYTRNTLHSLTLAYCCSIHKAQGSEFPIVILPVVKSYYRMLRRNLIYTAITRSKRFLLLCGEIEAFNIAVENRNQDSRNSLLQQKLKEAMQGIS